MLGHLVRQGFLDRKFLFDEGPDILREFKGCLERAVREYQEWHGLKITGEVDNATAGHMIHAKRICGYPDRMAMEKPQAWPCTDIKWTIDPGVKFADLALADVHLAFEWAWTQWAKVCGLQPSYVAAGQDVFVTTTAIDGPWGMLAWSEMPDGQQRVLRTQKFDTAEPWCISDAPPLMKIDLKRVALHEIGHVIGIAHLPAGGIMAPIYSQAIGTLQAEDIAEAQARYGKAA